MNISKSLFFFSLLLLFFGSAFSQNTETSDQPLLVIRPFSNPDKITAATSINEAFAKKLGKNKNFKHVDSTRQADFFLKKPAILEGDCGAPCLVTLGKGLEADLAISGILKKTAGAYELEVFMVNVSTGEIIQQEESSLGNNPTTAQIRARETAQLFSPPMVESEVRRSKMDKVAEGINKLVMWVLVPIALVIGAWWLSGKG